MPISSALVTRFFQFLVNRKFADAERELEKIRERMHETEWNRGYHLALSGMLIAQKSNSDNSTFLSKLDLNDEKTLQSNRKEFRNHTKHKLHDNLDRGFFSAWANCMRVLKILAAENPEAKSATVEETGSEASSEVKNQTEIESFLKIKPSA